jgi:hypothetical protein
VLVVSDPRGDSSWLSKQPFPSVIIRRGVAGSQQDSVPFETGMEAAAYLGFIVQNYDDLPTRMLFCHDEKILWPLSMVRTCRGRWRASSLHVV